MIPNLKLYAILAFAVIAMAAAGTVALRLRADGYNSRVVEETAAANRRTDNATRADDMSRRCAADPACRLSDDGYRRD